MTSIIFFGTPDFVVPILESLITKDFKVIAVVTQPDQPVGRKKTITPSPIKTKALELGIKVFTPEKLTSDFLSTLEQYTTQLTGNLQPDFAILAAYGKIIKPDLLNWPQYGFLNIHPSLLPCWRGATPTLPPILRGETTTGVTYTLMDADLDHGPIVASFKSPIKPEENRQTLTIRLFQEASQFLPEIINRYINHTDNWPLNTKYSFFSNPITQNHTIATFTSILKKEDGFISWETLSKAIQANDIDLSEFPTKLQLLIADIYTPSHGSKFLHQACLALSPWPGMWTLTPQNRRLKILTSQINNNRFSPLLVQMEGSTPTNWKLTQNLPKL